ncbi:uncharacterized protein PG998_011076 [Apiospora kogelbergensis]|uniref:uncharacterized protein n=1 Tax=Apiospora kogelbergensis TaxID=1337665 RepID=UPI0031300A83
MALQRAASLVGLRIPRDTLVARAKQLETKLGATSYRESLEDEGDYAQMSEEAEERTIKQSTYWSNRSLFPPPPEIIFTKEDLPARRRDRATGADLTTTMAGYELATYLRSRDYLALHVRPKMEPILPANLWESSLIKLMASLIANLCRLLPAAGIRSSPALQQSRFDALAAGGSTGSIEAGLAILEALSAVCLVAAQHGDGWGWRRLVIVVDELDYAEHHTTQDKVSRFVDVLRKICAKNDAPLIFTLSKPCNVVYV